jgi:hypothetical protein
LPNKLPTPGNCSINLKCFPILITNFHMSDLFVVLILQIRVNF